MGRIAHRKSVLKRRLVGIASESFSHFGRSVIRGVLQYANLQRDWEIYRDVVQVTTDLEWPTCDGTVVGGLRPGLHDSIRRHCRHLVSCSGFTDPDESPVVTLDDGAAGAMAAEHLLELGLRSFAFYGPPWVQNDEPAGRPRHLSARRELGFRQALQRKGFSCISFDAHSPALTELLTHAHHSKVIEWVRSLPKPVGIMTCDDPFANDLATACYKAGIFVPEHVAIVGVNNDELLCDSAWPPLTSIECSFERMGFQAAKMLDRIMRGEPLTPEERLTELPPVRVHPRGSTQLITAGEPTVAEAVRFIREHACDPCTVDDVTRAIVVSRSTLERRFEAALGRTVHDEIARARAEVAKRLLSQPGLTTGEIADRCGFTTVQGFSRFFRDNAGTTPAAFRRQSLPDASPLS